jgi:hypothetical protein
MKSPTKMLVVALALMAGCASAWADRGHARIGVYLGPIWGPWGYYPPPVYYSPPIVVERSPVYVETPPVVQAAPAISYWYFCRPANAYYPYVKDCPSGWERVSPSPAGQ